MNLLGKQIIVFGVGRSGLSAIRLLLSKSLDNFFVISRGEVRSWSGIQEILELVCEKNCFSDEYSNIENIILKSDLIVLSPGVPLDNKLLEFAKLNNVEIISEIELGFIYARKPIIAVTGTNGKTTTVTMIGEILKNSGHRPFIGGNIGVPFCEYGLSPNDYDCIVLELSSFQLETIKNFRANYSMILNIFPNHGERYSDISVYAKAKLNIAQNMSSGDLLLIPSNLPYKNLLNNTSFDIEEIDFNNLTFIRSEIEKDYTLDKFQLVGKHNITNLFVAIKLSKFLFNDLDTGIQQTIDRFQGVLYRLQKIKSNLNFEVLNDAKSTNWNATITALSSLEKKTGTTFLIVGGQKRGNNDSIIPYLSIIQESVDKILLIGDTAKFLASELDGHIEYEIVYNIKNAIELAAKKNDYGRLIFSPAFPSYDQFENYVKRGESFTSLIQDRGPKS